MREKGYMLGQFIFDQFLKSEKYITPRSSRRVFFSRLYPLTLTLSPALMFDILPTPRCTFLV